MLASKAPGTPAGPDDDTTPRYAAKENSDRRLCGAIPGKECVGGHPAGRHDARIEQRQHHVLRPQRGRPPCVEGGEEPELRLTGGPGGHLATQAAARATRRPPEVRRGRSRCPGDRALAGARRPTAPRRRSPNHPTHAPPTISSGCTTATGTASATTPAQAARTIRGASGARRRPIATTACATTATAAALTRHGSCNGPLGRDRRAGGSQAQHRHQHGAGQREPEERREAPGPNLPSAARRRSSAACWPARHAWHRATSSAKAASSSQRCRTTNAACWVHRRGRSDRRRTSGPAPGTRPRTSSQAAGGSSRPRASSVGGPVLPQAVSASGPSGSRPRSRMAAAAAPASYSPRRTSPADRAAP